MKIDLYNHEGRFKQWKEQALRKGYIESGLSKENSGILVKYTLDMEIGNNVSIRNKKGSRSYARLNSIRQKMAQMMRVLQEKKIKDITIINEEQIQHYFNSLRNGETKTQKGKKYKCTSDYVKIFKAFWHWYQLISKKKGRVVEDITVYIDSSQDEKPKWVYLNEDQINKLLNNCDPKYKPLFSFLYDSGARVTEAFSLQVQDISEDKGDIFVNIRQEISKTFGRKIKLLLCGKDIHEYIRRSELKPEDRLFAISNDMANRYLSKLSGEVFGSRTSEGGENYQHMTLYDFRHNSACYWLERYKNTMSLMYRFGWKSEKYILYYSEFKGKRDLIKSDDLLVDITKSELEKELNAMRRKTEKQATEMNQTHKDIERLNFLVQRIMTNND